MSEGQFLRRQAVKDKGPRSKGGVGGAPLILVTVQARGIDGLTTAVDVVSSWAASPDEILERIADEFYSIEQERFNSDGPGWTPLANSTLERKARLGYDMRILRQMGELERSLTQEGAPFSVRRAAGDTLILGTNRPGATAHQDSQRPWLPVRKLIDIGSKEQGRFKAVALEEAYNQVAARLGAL